jgi:hypothetical protein
MTPPLAPGVAGIPLNFFTGHWTIERVIEVEGATLDGEAWLVPINAVSLSYREAGRLTLPNGHILEAHRRYLYRRVGHAIEIDFDDGPDQGRLFVSLSFRGPALNEAQAVHRCGGDMYEVCYRLAPPFRFETDIKIAGPRKKYRIMSRYRRIE